MFLNNFKRIPFVFLFFIFFLFQKVDAATLWIESNASNIKVGDTITATLYVNASGEAINNVESELTASNFEIQSITNSGSILNMWVEQPISTLKTASLNGGVLNPGFSGSAGKVVSLSLKATKEGVGSLNFTSASVRANDGLGTDVLKSKSGLSVTISSNNIPSPPAPYIPEVKNQVETQNNNINRELRAPLIFAPTTPNSDEWYNVDKVTFNWNAPTNTVAIKTLLNSFPNSEPTILYDSTIKSRTISDISDGVWYFHLKYQTPEGWSQAAHKKIKIDTTPPESITVAQEILDPGIVKVKISAFDKTSYITKLILSIPGNNDIEIKEISKEGNGEYIFPANYQGLKEITIKAFDSASNVYEEKISINFPKVSIPVIETYPSEVVKGEEIVLSGNSNYSNSKVQLKVAIVNGKVEIFTSQTDQNGNFNFKIPSGIIRGEMTAFVEIFVGDLEVPVSSEKINIKIKGMNFQEIIENLLSNLFMFIPVLVTLIVLGFGIYFIISRFLLDSPEKERRKKIKRVEKEITELIESLKQLIIQDIHLISADRSIKDMEEVESLLLKNLLADFKDVQKRITNRFKRGKIIKKKIEVEEE